MTYDLVTEEDLQKPVTPRQRAEMALTFAEVLAAAVPTTSVPPMAATALRYKRFQNEEWFHRVHKMHEWAAFVTRHILRAPVHVEGRERLPGKQKGLLYISNHQSYVDIPVIMGALRLGAFLSKDLVAYIPVIGQIAWLGGTIYFNRRHPDSRRKALEDTLRMCAESTPVVVFPEGTRSRDGNLRPAIRPGTLHAAWERRLRVCAFALDGTRYIFPPSMDRVYRGQPVTIVVGQTLQPEQFETREAFAEAAWAEVRRCFLRARSLRQHRFLAPGSAPDSPG